jgi:hypothetical protein
MAEPRVEYAHFEQARRDAEARQVYVDLTHTRIPVPPLPKVAAAVVLDLPLPAEHWVPPGLVPLKLNLKHFGSVPSWEGAGSSGGSFVPILSFRFIAECAPVILLGLPFGLWLASRRRQPVLRVLVLLAAFSMVPPIFLDWGFRSTDFLRFFTGAFSFSALLLGWLVGYWWALGRIMARAAAVALCMLRACQSVHHRAARPQRIDICRGRGREPVGRLAAEGRAGAGKSHQTDRSACAGTARSRPCTGPCALPLRETSRRICKALGGGQAIPLSRDVRPGARDCHRAQ